MPPTKHGDEVPEQEYREPGLLNKHISKFGTTSEHLGQTESEDLEACRLFLLTPCQLLPARRETQGITFGPDAHTSLKALPHFSH